jgi:parallel beta-helix repeat protein
MRTPRQVLLSAALLSAVAGCDKATPAKPPGAAALSGPLRPGPDAQDRLQEALIKARPGDAIQLEEGVFALSRGLSLTVDNVTLRGRGMDKTVLSFKGQTSGSEGLLVKASGFVLEDIAFEDAKGDAVKVTDAKGVTLRRVRAEWTGGPKETNGAYGLYPVLSEDVLIEDCVAIGASDAGIYVGQSKNIIVRGSRAERNVAGIEIENSIGADVYGNVATQNTGGILVFNLPDLELKNGRGTRVFKNEVFENNHPNFAPQGNIVASVPPGTGVMVMAVDEIEVFENTISKNQTANLAIVSYVLTQRPIKDDKYDAYPEAIYVHDNAFDGGGESPEGALGLLAKPILGVPFPDIIYDGITDEKKLVDGKPASGRGIYFKNNGGADFANLNFGKLSPAEILTGKGKEVVSRDLAAHDGALPPLPEIKLAVGIRP